MKTAFKLDKLPYPFVVDKNGELITESSNHTDEEETRNRLLDLNHEYLFDMASRYAETQGMSCEEVHEEGRRLIVLTG